MGAPNFKPGELVGRTFARWTVIEDGLHIGERRAVHVRCACGADRLVLQESLLHGRSESCGCLHREAVTTHGRTHTPEYRSWRTMRARCADPKNHNWPRYGGRGIRVCERWHTFENFLADMGPKPSPKHTLDRIDNDGNYEPGNVRWATPREQQNNRRVNRRITVNGETLTIAQWAKRLGVHRATVRKRLEAGWSDERAATEPAHESARRSA